MPDFAEDNEFLAEYEDFWRDYADWHDWANQDTPLAEPTE